MANLCVKNRDRGQQIDSQRGCEEDIHVKEKIKLTEKKALSLIHSMEVGKA